VRVVLVFPPDDESETADESLGISLRDVHSLKGSLVFGAKVTDRPTIVRRSESPDVASCITESASTSSDSDDSPETAHHLARQTQAAATVAGKRHRSDHALTR
jgi:hypothetical protein